GRDCRSPEAGWKVWNRRGRVHGRRNSRKAGGSQPPGSRETEGRRCGQRHLGVEGKLCAEKWADQLSRSDVRSHRGHRATSGNLRTARRETGFSWHVAIAGEVIANHGWIQIVLAEAIRSLFPQEWNDGIADQGHGHARSAILRIGFSS